MMYRAKPPTVEARQLTLDQLADVASWSGGELVTDATGTRLVLQLDAMGTIQEAETGWWVTKDAAGGVYAYPPEVFTAAWEPAP